jgi:hypothetical protein
VGQPFDVVKVRYQTPEYAGRYSSTFSALGMFHCFGLESVLRDADDRVNCKGGKGMSRD